MVKLPVWKRAFAVVALLGISVWLTAMGLQTIRVECGGGQCVHQVSYAGITTRETPFVPSPTSVSWRRTGKYDNLGVVHILPASGGPLEVEWLSPTEAEHAAWGLLHDPRYVIESDGPRWWLLFLLGTIPFMLSFIVPARRIFQLAKAPPVEQTKKSARAARGKAKKTRARG